jgi:predicted phage terminase large subunit-like protein
MTGNDLKPDMGLLEVYRKKHLYRPPEGFFERLDKDRLVDQAAQKYAKKSDGIVKMMAFLAQNAHAMTSYEKVHFIELLKFKAFGKSSIYIPTVPTEHQIRFLVDERLEALYGGAAGGGKSEAVLMAALQHMDVPGYSALVLRRTYKELALPGALMDRARSWLTRPDIPEKLRPRWDSGSYSWVFPSGAKLTFGYLESFADTSRYQSAEFQFIAFDELTQFLETMYLYMFSRMRKTVGSEVPMRMRAATNPGNIGHEWVSARFIPEEYHYAPPDERFSRPWEVSDDRAFFPARLQDNKHVDRDSYQKSLDNLDPVTKAQLADGDWNVVGSGNIIKRDWICDFQFSSDRTSLLMKNRDFETGEEMPIRRVSFDSVVFRFVTADTAMKTNEYSDYTAIGSWGIAEVDGTWYLILFEVDRDRIAVPDLESRVIRMADDWLCSEIVVEDRVSGIGLIQSLRRSTKIPVTAFNPGTSDKVLRTSAIQTIGKSRRFFANARMKGYAEFVNELLAFPQGLFDDQVDMSSMAAWKFMKMATGIKSSAVPLPVTDRGHPVLGGFSIGVPATARKTK